MITINSSNAVTLIGNYIYAPRVSGAEIDYETDDRVVVNLDGKEYERTVYERVVWRNQAEYTVVARFVWIKGMFYVIDWAIA